MEASTVDARLRDVLVIVSCSHAAVMVLQVPSQLILAASPGAHELLDGIAQPLIGRRLEDFTANRPSGAMPLLADGQICGYETVCALKLTGERRRLWIRALAESHPPRHALAVLMKEDVTGRLIIPLKDEATWPVIGSTDARLIIDRISPGVQDCLGFPPENVIGMSLLTLVVPTDTAEVLSAMAQLPKEKEGISVRVHIIGADFSLISCQLVLLPLEPTPSVAFALLTDGSEGDGSPDGRSVTHLIARLSRGLQAPTPAPAVASALMRPDVDLGQLSSRELEIVSLLVAGNRVSSIAGLLFLSDGTIRNHLSTAFGKLGVKTQQQLIELLRPGSTSPPPDRDQLGQNL
jgi:DNA-binding CsgD family transcriptional regulator